MVKSVFSHCFFFSFLALQHMIADMRTKYAEGFFYTHKPSYVCKDWSSPAQILRSFGCLVIYWLLWLARHMWQSNMLFHLGASSWVLVGFLVKMWVQTIGLWYSLNRGNLEVYSYHGEYAEVSARSLWPSLCRKGLASLQVFTWLPVETRTVLLSPPQWISCWFCLCWVCYWILLSFVNLTFDCLRFLLVRLGELYEFSPT